MLDNLSAASLSFLILFVMFVPLERAFPANVRQTIFRREWWTDLAFFLGQYLLWGGLVLWGLSTSKGLCLSFIPQEFRERVAAQPWLLQATEAVLLGDFCVYWFHRLQHRVEFLWRFHAVHHTAEHLDWLAAHREHPIDGLLTQLIVNLPAFILGFPISTLAGLAAFRGIWAIYIHSNSKIPLGPLRGLIGSPELHHWHHSKEKESCNFANLSPLMDIIFGTYRCPDREPPELGIAEPFPRSYLGQLAYPLWRGGRKFRRKEN